MIWHSELQIGQDWDKYYGAIIHLRRSTFCQQIHSKGLQKVQISAQTQLWILDFVPRHLPKHHCDGFPRRASGGGLQEQHWRRCAVRLLVFSWWRRTCGGDAAAALSVCLDLNISPLSGFWTRNTRITIRSTTCKCPHISSCFYLVYLSMFFLLHLKNRAAY